MLDLPNLSSLKRGARNDGEALPSGDGVVAVLGDVLVGLLGGLGGGALDGLSDVVGGLLSGIHVDGLVVLFV